MKLYKDMSTSKNISTNIQNISWSKSSCCCLQDRVEETVKQLKAKGITAIGTSANVSKVPDIRKVIELAIESFGRIDVLVSNAAVNPSASAILDTPDWAIEKLLEVNVKSVIHLLQEARPHMSQVSEKGICYMNEAHSRICQRMKVFRAFLMVPRHFEFLVLLFAWRLLKGVLQNLAG